MFSLAETDPALRESVPILADRMDGAPIAEEEGPYRLVVPGDKRAARSVRMVQVIRVVANATPPEPPRPGH
jgi:DMSO/TMAO reductase YedYZ molybdopterin-dependent catalytic subunit